MRWKKYIFFLLFPSVVIPVYAQETLTLERCRELALERNKSIERADENRKKAGYGTKVYLSNYLPKFSAAGNYLYTSTKLKKTLPGSYLPTFIPDGNGGLIPNLLTTIDGTPVFKEYAYFPDLDINFGLSGLYTAGIRVEQPIYTGGKVTAAYKMSRIGEEIAGLQQVLTRTEVILLSDEAYWTYIQTLELTKTAKAYKELIIGLRKDVENAYQAGLKSRNDVLKVQVKLNEAELQVLQAENAVRLARMNLCHVIGLPLTTRVYVENMAEENTTFLLSSTDITGRPEYHILSKQVELKGEETRLARSEFLPNIGVMGNFGYANGLKLNGEKLLDKTSFSAVVSVQIPLFNWGEGCNKVRSVKAEKRMAALQLEDATEKMELELMQAVNEVEEKEMEVKLTTRSLEQAEENLKTSRDHFNVGMETLTDHLEAQSLWQKACSDHIRAQTSSRLSKTKYLKAAGKL